MKFNLFRNVHNLWENTAKIIHKLRYNSAAAAEDEG